MTEKKEDNKEVEGEKTTEKDVEKGSSNNNAEVPDGGWGWLIVLGVSLSNMTTQALVSVFGFLFSQRLRELDIATSGAATILSIQSTVMNLSGLCTGALIRKFSYQKVAISGALLMMTGLMLTTLADSLTSYLLTYSLFTGLGLGFLYPSTFVAVNSYFSNKRGIAVGWSVTGTGVGQMLLPLLVSYLLEEYGFRGTILILAGLSGHSLVAALLYQPVSWHMKKKKTINVIELEKEKQRPTAEITPVKKSLDSLADNDDAVKGLSIRRLSEPISRCTTSLHSIELEPSSDAVSSNNNTQIHSQVKEKEDGVKQKPESKWMRVVHVLDYDLLKNGSFLVVVVGCGVVYTANTSFQMLYPLFLESLLYTRKEVASCMVVLSAFDIVGRPVLPYVVRLFDVRAKTILFVSALASAIFRSGLATQSKMVPILILSALCGLFRSAIITNMNLSVAEQTNREKLPAALGLQMVIKGLASMSLGPLIGIIRDRSHSYELCIHILSIFFMGLPFMAYLFERICTKKPS